jgi:hypothetical protein
MLRGQQRFRLAIAQCCPAAPGGCQERSRLEIEKKKKKRNRFFKERRRRRRRSSGLVVFVVTGAETPYVLNTCWMSLYI